jgi:hypothetical protein
MASNDPCRDQVWAYADALSYRPGQTLTLHAMSSAATARLQIERDGINPQSVLDRQIATQFAKTPADCSVRGCGWPVAFQMIIPDDWQSGVCVLTLTVPGHQSQTMFALRAEQPVTRIAMILETGTWCAYNDWGGSNHYQGLTGDTGGEFAPHVSLLRPWATGFVRWPDDAPRIPHASPLLTRPP